MTVKRDMGDDAASAGTVELRAGNATGAALLGSCAVPPTGAWDAYANVTCDGALPAAAQTDLLLSFKGAAQEFARLDYLRLTC